MKHVEDLLSSLFVMASMVEARDPYTGGHLWRVSQFSRLLATEAGLPGADVARISIGGFLHDLGKIGVPDSILNKEGPLDDGEYEVIKTHPSVGNRLLAGHPLGTLVRAAVLSHHETPAGTGYPLRLSGDAIPLDARIVGICDAFDAMTSNRPYRREMPIGRALEIIEGNLGRQFDPVYGKRFIAMGRDGMLDAIVGHSEPGIPIQDCPLCGPTIVITRHNHSGDHVYCRHCGGEAVVEREGESIRLRPTGRQGEADHLEPEIDVDLISELVKESAHHLSVRGGPDGMRQMAPPDSAHLGA